jgi:hypothetical protein
MTYPTRIQPWNFAHYLFPCSYIFSVVACVHVVGPVGPPFTTSWSEETSGHACRYNIYVTFMPEIGFAISCLVSYFNNVPLINDATEHCIKPLQTARAKPRFLVARWEPC